MLNFLLCINVTRNIRNKLLCFDLCTGSPGYICDTSILDVIRSHYQERNSPILGLPSAQS